MSASVVVDSSIWIEILNGGRLASKCESEILSHGLIFVPSVVVFEVYRKVKVLTSEDVALSVLARLQTHQILDLTPEVAATAADLSIQNGLGMADSIVLAHAQLHQVKLLTLDHDFHGLSGAKVLN